MTCNHVQITHMVAVGTDRTTTAKPPHEPLEGNLMKAQDRSYARRTADALGNVARRSALSALLTQDEVDWLHLLQERLYEIGHGRVEAARSPNVLLIDTMRHPVGLVVRTRLEATR